MFQGLTACGTAAMRRRTGVRAIVWVGIRSATYGELRRAADDLRMSW